MQPMPCVNCGDFFTPRNRDQNYCTKADCQRARKAAWQRNKLRRDPEYKANQPLSQKKWLQQNPTYWKKYRKNNPEKAKRNRLLQQIRNQQRRHGLPSDVKIEVTLIAKMDAAKIFIRSIPKSYI